MVGGKRMIFKELIRININRGQTTFSHDSFLCSSHYRLFAYTAFLLFLELLGDQALRLFLL